MAPFSALRHPGEPLLDPYWTRDLCPVNLCPRPLFFYHVGVPNPAWSFRLGPLLGLGLGSWVEFAIRRAGLSPTLAR